VSEPKLISPMLDNFAMGDPISDRNGVRCCPAMEKDTDNRYIVKIISNPPSQTQLEALLLSGAYSDKESALAYYKAISDDIAEEVNILQKLSRLEGFIAFNDHQIVPIDGDAGYDVYLLSEYRNTLEQAFRHSSMTHLTALNLGLDLCAALAVCRQSGYLYVDLKPDNIYLTAENTYRIGDIGFLKLNSLKYASLPDRYRSQYTAPEITDAYSSLNTTVDIYALGLILYRAFNNGALPFHSEESPTGEFPPPAYADYEMAEIIMKACNPDPEARWQDPIEMGQALISYMQRNGAHDTPIVTESEATVTDTESEEHAPKYIANDDANEDTPEIEVTESDDAIQEEIVEETITEESIYEEDNEGNLTFIVDESEDETAQEHDPDEIDYEEVSDEVSDMLNVADDLIAHQAPDPVVQPEPIDVPIPEPIPVEVEEEESTQEDEEEDIPCQSDEEIPADNETECNNDEEIIQDDDSEEIDEENKPRKSKWLVNAILILAAVAVIVAAFFCYKNFYLQPIESIILEDIDAGNITVLVSSQISEDKLSVICSDTYGNQLTSPVINGKATFTDLSPNSAYTIKVVITGFHKLTGDTSAAFTTPTQTNIVQLQAVTGSEEGSAVVSFTIDGPDANEWKITYKSENETEKEVTFSGHMATLTGLTVGSVYDITLAPVEDILTTGTTQITHTASKIVKPVNLAITSCKDGALTATWMVPEGATVESWTVRCYNEAGFDETKVVEETTAVFEGIDVASAYTVEVTAAGMSVNERAFAPANSITVDNFKVSETNTNTLTLSWECKVTPEGGWLILYSVGGSTAQEISCETGNAVTLDKVVPGAKYVFTLQAADGTSGLLGNTLHFTAPAAKDFSDYGLSKDTMEFKMCKTPSFKGWDRWDLSSDDYSTEFAVGTNASFLIHANKGYSTSSDEINILFVICDENGTVVNTSSVSSPWRKLWYRNYCELDVPTIPQAPGKYKISVYFNGALANEQNFTVTD